MKRKLLNISIAALIGMYGVNAHSFFALPNISSGVGVFTHTVATQPHVFPQCIVEGPLCVLALEPNTPWITVWFDLLLNGATALDLAASLFQGDRTIDASDAIKKLEDSLKGNGGQGGSGGGDTSGNATMATVYTPDHIMSVIEVSENKKQQSLFDSVRQAIQEYVFETSAPDIKEDCAQSDKDCAIARQNEWLLASLTLASATADKVLDQTAKKNVQDARAEAEKSEDDQTKEKSTSGGGTSLTGHFSSLAASFNAAKSPMDLYNAMANIVLDTHRQANDANALMGRDLEATGLRIINETGPESLVEETGEE